MWMLDGQKHEEETAMSAPIPMPPQDNIISLLMRIERAEQDIKDVKAQLGAFVPAREHSLQLTAIEDTVHRIEIDVSRVKERLTSMTETITKQEQDARQRDTETQKASAQLQIRVLWFVVSTIITIAMLTLVAFLTHLIH